MVNEKEVQAVVKMLDSVSNTSYKLAKYLLTHMNSLNLVVKTIREISQDTGLGEPMITKYFQKFEKLGLIKRKTGVITVLILPISEELKKLL